MEKWMKRTVQLGAALAFTGKSNPSVVPYYPQKTAVSGEEERYFHRTYPEHVGVSSGRVLAMLRALEREKRANVHNLIVIKDGVVISECSHPGYDVNVWHLSHSMTKTVTGMAIGLLVSDGLLTLDTRLVDLFPDEYYNDKRFKNITVKHLLTMTAGVRFAEAGSVTENKWTEAFFASALAFNPGEQFSYNSMNSYILALIVTKVTGKSLSELVNERIFQPMGISNVHWELGPEGVEKGGWGIYMSCESWAKLGFMMLSGGFFEGRSILPYEWVVESTTAHAATSDLLGQFDYGYQLWVSSTDDGYLFNGMFGQNVWVCPRNNIVVALNSGNNELFQNGPALAIIEKYMGQDLTCDLSESCFAGDLVDLRRCEEHFFECRHWIRPAEMRKGIGYRLGLRSRTPYLEEWDELLGKYNFRKNNYGVLPLMVRAMQNNLKNSIDGASFEREGEQLFFGFAEGGVPYRLEVGLYEFKCTVIDYHGEKYMVNVMGEAMEDEDRNILFKLELLFPELPNTRMLKFSVPAEGQLLMRMGEIPNEKITDDFFENMSELNPRLAFAFDLIERRIGRNYVRKKLHETFAPELIGAKVGAPNYVQIMDREREALKANEKNIKLINTIIDKFLRDEDDEIEGESIEQKSGFRAFINEIKERIKQRRAAITVLPEAETTDAPAELPSAD